MSFSYENITFYLIIFATIIFLISFVFRITLILFTRFQKTITVSEKYVRPSNKSVRYHVIDNDYNNYQLVDSVFLMEFDSGSDYAKLKPGQTYKVHGYGFRYPMLSMYPRIYKVEQV